MNRLVHSICKSTDSRLHVYIRVLEEFFSLQKYFFNCEVMHSLNCVLHLYMRDEKEGRKKQARSNKQQGKAAQHTQGSHFF